MTRKQKNGRTSSATNSGVNKSPNKAFPQYAPNQELDNILSQAHDGAFDERPHGLFTAIAASLAKRGLPNQRMYTLYERIGPWLKKPSS